DVNAALGGGVQMSYLPTLNWAMVIASEMLRPVPQTTQARRFATATRTWWPRRTVRRPTARWLMTNNGAREEWGMSLTFHESCNRPVGAPEAQAKVVSTSRNNRPRMKTAIRCEVMNTIR